MLKKRDNKPKGFYGPDGEFYPASSQTAQQLKAPQEDIELYPKRPEIKYTTAPFPGTEPPAVIKEENSDPLSGYTGELKYCKHCGNKMPVQAIMCTRCGTNAGGNYRSSYPAASYNNYGYRKTRRKWIAFFLCFFGGVFGLHRFYEGKVISGIIYLCSFGLLGIGVFIDLVRLAAKSDPYYV